VGPSDLAIRQEMFKEMLGAPKSEHEAIRARYAERQRQEERTNGLARVTRQDLEAQLS
jgi:hypothetical protein